MLAIELARYLHDKGLVTFDQNGSQGSCFIGTIPPKPDEAVAIYHYEGLPASTVHGYDSPRLQVRVRGTEDPRVGFQLAQSIYEALHGFEGYLVEGGYWIVSCEGLQSGPVHIGTDQNGRHEYTVNLEIEIRNKTINRE